MSAATRSALRAEARRQGHVYSDDTPSLNRVYFNLALAAFRRGDLRMFNYYERKITGGTLPLALSKLI